MKTRMKSTAKMATSATGETLARSVVRTRDVTATDANVAQLETIKTDLTKYCPVAKVMRAAVIVTTENWTTRPL